MKPFPGTVTRGGVGGKISLTDEQKDWLRQWFPITENRRLAKAMGTSESTMHRLARDLGLVKSEKGMKAIMRRQAKLCKKVNEKSGYYDSIRGRKPSEAAQEGTRRMWKEIREGKRPHPFHVLKKKRPRRYKQLMKERSEQRREAIRRDVIRLKWGLPKKTNLKCVVMQPYTKQQTSRRYFALKRGYILASDCSEGSGHRYMIYYDEKTNRSPIFERNGIRDGFRFAEWAE